MMASKLAEALLLADASDTVTQQKVLGFISEASNHPEYHLWLMEIFNDKRNPINVRQRSGLLLKTLLNQSINLASDLNLRSSILLGLDDKQTVIQKTTGSLITTMVSSGSEWPEIIKYLSERFLVSQACMDATLKISEDIVAIWRQATPQERYKFDWFFNIVRVSLMPVLFMNISETSLKVLNVFALNFLFMENFQFSQYLQNYVEFVFKLANTEQGIVGISYLAGNHSEFLLPNFAEICQRFVEIMESSNYDLKLKAVEFWISVTSDSDLAEKMGNLSRLIPALVKNMRFSEADFLAMNADDFSQETANQEDRPEDIAPFARHNDVDEDEETNTWGNEWTLRKASAQALDQLSISIGNESEDFLTIYLPLVDKLLNADSNWELQESGILSLGAVATGCHRIEKYLSPILEILCQKFLVHSNPLIRSITCWTISRYTAWISGEFQKNTVLPVVLQKIFSVLIEDRNKRVQEGAINCLHRIIEDSEIDRYYTSLVPILLKCMQGYKTRNFLLLLNLLGLLFVDVNMTLEQQEILSPLVDPIFSRFVQTADKTMFIATADCLAVMAHCLTDERIRMIIVRCGVLLQTNLENELEILPSALELLASLVRTLGEQKAAKYLESLNFAPLVCEIINNLGRDANDSTDSDEMAVLQSAITLYGDILICAISLVPKECLQTTTVRLFELVGTGNFSVTNNSLWALGETAVRMEIPVDIAMDKLSLVLRLDNFVRPLLQQNAAILLGKLGLNHKIAGNYRFIEYIRPFCEIIKKMVTNQDKILAVSGFTKSYLEIGNIELLAVLEMVASFYPPPPALVPGFRQLCQNLDNIVGLKPEIRIKLLHVYGK
jgi:transportin-1